MPSDPSAARPGLRLLNPFREFASLADRFFELPPTVKRPILFLGAVLIIVMPALLYNMAAQSSYDASTWVAHTSAVKGKVYETLYHLRDGEAAARTLMIASIPMATVDFDTAMGKLDGDLADLRTLCIDNPRQQERIGALRLAIDGRNRALHQAVRLSQQGQRAAATAALTQSFYDFPFRETSEAMIAEEQGLLQQRIDTASQKKRTASLLLVFASFAQFLLLALVYFVSEKDSRRRQVAENDAKAAAAQARSVVESNPDPLAVLDHNGRLQDANKAFFTAYRTDHAEARGRFLREIGAGAWDIPELHQRLIDLVPRQREIWDMEITQNLSGEERHVIVNARPFPGIGGRKMILLAAKDITARKRSEDQIVRLNDALNVRVEQSQAMNQELEAFSYSVSHDLRAPLRHITGFSDMLQSHLKAGTPDEKTLRYLKYILESANQMGTLIDDLLVFSRMGRTEMVGEPVDMEALVRETVRHFNLEIEGRKVAFQIDSLPAAKGDAAMLRLVWMNLIGNAVKYSRSREEARIEIGSRPGDGKETVYFVRDNGVGFNMKYLHKLFGVFQRLHQAHEYEGTGIGLANVRRIVQRHGGRVWAEGEVDQGATFFFSLLPEPHLHHSLSDPDAPATSKGYLSQLARPDPSTPATP